MTTRMIRLPDVAFLRDYLRAVGGTVLDFARDYFTEVGPFSLVLLVAGWTDLFRNRRREALASVLLFPSYTPHGLLVGHDEGSLCGADHPVNGIRWPLVGFAVLLRGRLA